MIMGERVYKIVGFWKLWHLVWSNFAWRIGWKSSFWQLRPYDTEILPFSFGFYFKPPPNLWLCWVPCCDRHPKFWGASGSSRDFMDFASFVSWRRLREIWEIVPCFPSPFHSPMFLLYVGVLMYRMQYNRIRHDVMWKDIVGMILYDIHSYIHVDFQESLRSRPFWLSSIDLKFF